MKSTVLLALILDLLNLAFIGEIQQNFYLAAAGVIPVFLIAVLFRHAWSREALANFDPRRAKQRRTLLRICKNSLKLLKERLRRASIWRASSERPSDSWRRSKNATKVSGNLIEQGVGYVAGTTMTILTLAKIGRRVVLWL